MTAYFQGYCVFLKQALAVISFFKGNELIRNSIYSMNSEIKEQMQPNILSNLLYFAEEEL